MWIRAQRSADRKLADLCGSELSAAQIGNLLTFVDRNSAQRRSETCSPPSTSTSLRLLLLLHLPLSSSPILHPPSSLLSSSLRLSVASSRGCTEPETDCRQVSSEGAQRKFHQEAAQSLSLPANVIGACAAANFIKGLHGALDYRQAVVGEPLAAGAFHQGVHRA